MSAADQSAMVIRDNTANPAPLGLLAFGMTTVLLNFANAGVYELSSMVLAMGIFYGGLAQVIAGALEWKKNNTFGMTAFLSYGMFWLSLVALILLPELFPKIAGPNATAMAVYLSMWGLFTLVMFFGTLKINRALQVVFGTLTILFILLAAAEATGNSAVHHIAGYEGIFCGLSAMYAGLAQILNELYGSTVMPLGSMKK
jgi:succinate-acetate transporter protein